MLCGFDVPYGLHGDQTDLPTQIADLGERWITPEINPLQDPTYLRDQVR
jgi:hypothetical protein